MSVLYRSGDKQAKVVESWALVQQQHCRHALTKTAGDKHTGKQEGGACVELALCLLGSALTEAARNGNVQATLIITQDDWAAPVSLPLHRLLSSLEGCLVLPLQGTFPLVSILFGSQPGLACFSLQPLYDHLRCMLDDLPCRSAL